MDQPSPRHTHAEAGRRLIRTHSISTGIEAAVLLLIGYMFIDPPDLNRASSAIEWAAFLIAHAFRTGGILMLCVAASCLLGWRSALAFDAVVSLAIGIVLVLCGGYALISGGDLSGALFTLIGLFDLYAAARSWYLHNSIRGRAGHVPYEFGEESSVPPEAARAVRTPQQAAVAREQALRRLLKSKEKAAEPDPRPASHESSPEPEINLPDLDEPDAYSIRPEEKPSSSPPTASAGPRGKPEVARHSDADDDAPSGFLAELGRDDPTEKK